MTAPATASVARSTPIPFVLSFMPLQEFARLCGVDLSARIRKDIDAKVRGAAYTNIGGKGVTYYGIGSSLARIVDAILHDQRAVLTVGTPFQDVLGVRDVTVSKQRLVGRQGSWKPFRSPSTTPKAQAEVRALR
jgi:L-lactate dehydrogenase